jgi:hypothetical protein
MAMEKRIDQGEGGEGAEPPKTVIGRIHSESVLRDGFRSRISGAGQILPALSRWETSGERQARLELLLPKRRGVRLPTSIQD